MVLGKLPVPGRLTYRLDNSRARALAVGAGGGSFDIFLSSIISPSPSLWEMARYRQKYCLKGQLNPKQPATNIDNSRAKGILCWPGFG